MGGKLPEPAPVRTRCSIGRSPSLSCACSCYAGFGTAPFPQTLPLATCMHAMPGRGGCSCRRRAGRLMRGCWRSTPQRAALARKQLGFFCWRAPPQRCQSHLSCYQAIHALLAAQAPASLHLLEEPPLKPLAPPHPAIRRRGGDMAGTLARVVIAPQRVWGAYLANLQRAPRKTKCATSVVAAVLGDAIAQFISHSDERRSDWE